MFFCDIPKRITFLYNVNFQVHSNSFHFWADYSLTTYAQKCQKLNLNKYEFFHKKCPLNLSWAAVSIIYSINSNSKPNNRTVSPSLAPRFLNSSSTPMPLSCLAKRSTDLLHVISSMLNHFYTFPPEKTIAPLLS